MELLLEEVVGSLVAMDRMEMMATVVEWVDTAAARMVVDNNGEA